MQMVGITVRYTETWTVSPVPRAVENIAGISWVPSRTYVYWVKYQPPRGWGKLGHHDSCFGEVMSNMVLLFP